MANGVRSKLNFYRQRDCRRSRSTPRRVTMRRRNKVPLLVSFLLISLFLANAQTQRQTSSQTPPVPSASAQSAGASTVAPNASQNPDSDSGTFVFRKQVEEVVLHATVVDDK